MFFAFIAAGAWLTMEVLGGTHLSTVENKLDDMKNENRGHR